MAKDVAGRIHTDHASGPPGQRGLRLGAWEMGTQLSQNNEDRTRDIKSDSGKSRERCRHRDRAVTKFIHPDENTSPSVSVLNSCFLLLGCKFLTHRGYILFFWGCSGPGTW